MLAQHFQLNINWFVVLIAAGLCTLGFYMHSHPMNISELLLPAIVWTTLFYIVGYLCSEGLPFGQKALAFFKEIENLLPKAIWSIKTGGWRIVVAVWVCVVGIVPGWTKAYYSDESSLLVLYFISLIWAGSTFVLSFFTRRVAKEKEREALEKHLTSILPDASLEAQMVWAVAHGDDRKVDALLKQGVPPNLINMRGDSLLKLIITKEGLDINKRLYVMRLLLERLSVREINAKDANGWTPLMYATARADCSHAEIGELLLHDADPSILNDERESARDIIANRNGPGYPRMRELEVFDKQWALNRVQEDLSLMHSSRARMMKLKEEREKENELPSILERNKRALSLSIVIGILFSIFLFILV